MKKPLIISIIPARGGSKRLLKKNIREFGGFPLLAYSIAISLNSNLISHTFVSTEDAEIARTAEKFGSKVLQRSSKLSTDSASSYDVIMESLSKN